MFNEQVRDKLVDSVASALDQEPPAIEKAKALIKEGEKLIDVRQKHIKIADRSEYGWAVATAGGGEHAQSSGTPALSGLLTQQLLQSDPRLHIATGGSACFPWPVGPLC